jgi:hypothetical protein
MGSTQEELVISGISGKFPESANMEEFRENLYGHVNMVTVNERRFKAGLHGIPKGFGALKEIDKFDADFFQIHQKQADRMDPQLRMMLEATYEALQDAGKGFHTSGLLLYLICMVRFFCMYMLYAFMHRRPLRMEFHALQEQKLHKNIK